MIIFLLIIGLIISLGLNITAIILIRLLLRKIRVYELWVINTYQNVTDIIAEMRTIDRDATFKSSFESTGKGVFESDDQVGAVFKALLELVEELDNRIQ